MINILKHLLLPPLLLLILLPAAGISVYRECTAAENNALLVLGSLNELKDEHWKDERIGFGLRSLITQAFFDVGAFSVIEEKPEIREKLRAVSQGMWAAGDNKYDVTKDAEEAKLLGAQYVAYGRVYYFGRPLTKMSVGVLQSRTAETIIRIEIILRNTGNGKTIKKSGTGKAETAANSAFFEVRDDSVLFDETAIGTATKKAIGEAVADIMKDFKKIQ
ncbi:CsgG/HfaB family protein [bacterium]|nr:CsgG/HfaB family protein [bacterium]